MAICIHVASSECLGSCVSGLAKKRRVGEAENARPPAEVRHFGPVYTVNGIAEEMTARLAESVASKNVHRSKRIALCFPLAPHTRDIVRNFIVACVQRTMQPA